MRRAGWSRSARVLVCAALKATGARTAASRCPSSSAVHPQPRLPEALQLISLGHGAADFRTLRRMRQSDHRRDSAARRPEHHRFQGGIESSAFTPAAACWPSGRRLTPAGRGLALRRRSSRMPDQTPRRKRSPPASCTVPAQGGCSMRFRRRCRCKPNADAGRGDRRGLGRPGARSRRICVRPRDVRGPARGARTYERAQGSWQTAACSGTKPGSRRSASRRTSGSSRSPTSCARGRRRDRPSGYRPRHHHVPAVEPHQGEAERVCAPGSARRCANPVGVRERA